MEGLSTEELMVAGGPARMVHYSVDLSLEGQKVLLLESMLVLLMGRD